MPYLIITRTPPTTGAMACCHSTIGAGQCGHMIEQSRRAVTAIGLRDAIRDIMLDRAMEASPPWTEGSNAKDWAAIESLPESGGTIGPLPDGAVITVEAVAWHLSDLTAYNQKEN